MTTTIHPDATITIAEARDNLSDLYNRAAYGQERILLTRHGKGQVALIPVEDLEELEALEDMVDRELLRQAREENEREGTIPWEDVKAELGLD